MFDHPAFPVVFFLASGFIFGIAVLYALARAWEKALEPRQTSLRQDHRQETQAPERNVARTRIHDEA